jgi:hypothetical protein
MINESLTFPQKKKKKKKTFIKKLKFKGVGGVGVVADRGF